MPNKFYISDWHYGHTNCLAFDNRPFKTIEEMNAALVDKNHFYGWFHLYGHVHNSFEFNMMEHDKYLMEELYTRPCKMYNVGAMMPWMNYTPRTLDEILAACEDKTC